MKKSHISLVTFAIITIMGMDMIDTTVMNNILPRIAESLHSTPIHLKMGISIYMVVMGLFLPISSWMAEKFGYRNTLMFAASGFAFFSMMSGLAFSDTQIITYRACQGLFAAFSAPVAGLAYLKFSENMLEGTASLSNYTLTLAIAGQILGGIFASISPESWRLAFLMQVPFAAFAVYMLYRYYPKETLYNQGKKFDFLGLSLLGSSIAAMFVISEFLLKANFPIGLKFALFGFVCVALSTYAFIYKRIKSPVIDFSVFRNRQFTVPFMSNFFCRFSTYWVFFAWPVVLYYLSHLNTIYITLMSVCIMIGTIVSKRLTKNLVYHYGYKPCMMTGLLLLAISLTVSIIFDIHYYYYAFCLMAFALGFSLGMYQTSSNAAAYTAFPPSKLDSINTLKNSSNMLSAAFALVAYTIAYDSYFLVGTHHHWINTFKDSYYGVVLTAAIAQIILAVYIYFRMQNRFEVKH